MSNLPDKPVAALTDEELAAVIEQHQGDDRPAMQQIVQGCWRQIERRNGLEER
ncbi:hypothetical protein OG416_38960 [Streptomyces longwoodensis]|uniref:hypothetical protein n=1 Tax=Streptomyces longwoodensis TaxID=68231 RepID=UPI0030DFD034|nr:hypothetical protein OG416_38960 [Streptomyces longwoodensis]